MALYVQSVEGNRYTSSDRRRRCLSYILFLLMDSVYGFYLLLEVEKCLYFHTYTSCLLIKSFVTDYKDLFRCNESHKQIVHLHIHCLGIM